MSERPLLEWRETEPGVQAATVGTLTAKLVGGPGDWHLRMEGSESNYHAFFTIDDRAKADAEQYVQIHRKQLIREAERVRSGALQADCEAWGIPFPAPSTDPALIPFESLPPEERQRIEERARQLVAEGR